MDMETFKDEVDKRCKEAMEFVSSVNKSLHGASLREKMFELLSFLSRFNELSDKALFRYNIQKRKVDLIESLAMQDLCADQTTKIPATLKEYHLDNREVTNGTEKTTLYNEKIKLENYQYASNRFKSIFELLRTTIMIVQSGLSFDREELKNTNYT